MSVSFPLPISAIIHVCNIFIFSFTKNLSVFRRDVNCSVKDELSPHPPSMSAINDMMV